MARSKYLRLTRRFNETKQLLATNEKKMQEVLQKISIQNRSSAFDDHILKAQLVELLKSHKKISGTLANISKEIAYFKPNYDKKKEGTALSKKAMQHRIRIWLSIKGKELSNLTANIKSRAKKLNITLYECWEELYLILKENKKLPKDKVINLSVLTT